MISDDVFNNVIGVGWVVVALVLAIGILGLINKGKIRKLSVNAGPVHANVDMSDLKSELKEVREAVAVITTAVKNGKPETLVERVENIEKNLVLSTSHQEFERAQHAWLTDTLTGLAKHVGYKTSDAPHISNTGDNKQGVMSA